MRVCKKCSNIVNCLHETPLYAKGDLFLDPYFFDERSQREEIEARTLIDLDFSYQASETVQLILGAINVFDTYPNEVVTRASQGMPFPRRTPIGYSGGQVYFKAIYKL